MDGFDCIKFKTAKDTLKKTRRNIFGIYYKELLPIIYKTLL